MILLVSYDLKVPGRDYAKLFETLKSASGWWHYLESTWVLSTTDSVAAWTDRIRATMDENDLFIIIDITGKTRNGWLTKDAWEWLKNHDH